MKNIENRLNNENYINKKNINNSKNKSFIIFIILFIMIFIFIPFFSLILQWLPFYISIILSSPFIIILTITIVMIFLDYKNNDEKIKSFKHIKPLNINKLDNNKFKIEFISDSLWPYDYLFNRIDFYYNKIFKSRWSYKFPLKNKIFDNTEIFLETDYIIICTWERSWLIKSEQTFIDIINIKTQKKQRFFTDEVNIIFNMQDKIFLNIGEKWIYKTYILDINTLNILEEKGEYLQAFFKFVYNTSLKKWFFLNFDEKYKWHNEWYYEMIEFNEINEIPISFDRKKLIINDHINILELFN